jgi:hypothetical protein
MYELNKSELLKAAPPGLEEDSAPEGSESAPAPEGTPEGGESPSAEAGAPSPDASAPSPDAVPPEASDSSDAPVDPAAVAPEGEQQLSPEALQAEYSQLSPEELDMHLQAAMAAKEALAGGAPGAGPVAPPAGPPGAPPAMKAEIKVDKKAIGGTIKSEKVEELEALVKSQAEDIQNLTKAVQMVMERPVRKGVTSVANVAYLSKSEEVKEEKSFSPAEAREKLKELIPTLNKSERDLVLGFFEGRTPVAKLDKILEKVK